MIGTFIPQLSDKELKSYRWHLNDLLMRYRKYGFCAKFGIGERWKELKNLLDSELKKRGFVTTIKMNYD